jgi:hypothetical protein
LVDEEQLTTCPVCQWTPVEAWWNEHKKEVDCPVCGKFSIYVELNQWLWNQRNAGHLTQPQQDTLRRLSIAIRHSPTPPYIRFENWEQLAAEVPRFSMAAKLRRLIEAVGRLATPGQQFSINNADFQRLVTEIAAINGDEVVMLLKHLIVRGYLTGNWTSDGFRQGLVTVLGWEQLEPLGGGVPGRVFVAMWFDASMDDAYANGFSLGIKDCGLEPRRIDRLDFASKICDRILAEVRAAELVVADFTGFRSGVFFEAGFALGLERLVVFTCRQDGFAELPNHFDTRQYPHIGWSDPGDLRAKLADRIRALRSVPRGI